MRKVFTSSLFLSVLTGLLLGLAFPPIETGLTAFIAFVPFLFVMEHMRTWGQAFRFSYVAFAVFNFATVYWISGWTGDDIWLKIAGVAVNLIHPLLFTIPAVAYYLVRKRTNLKFALLFFPLMWVSFEWLAHLPELSFPWLVLANTQTYEIAKIQFITLTGQWGISLWIVAVNALIFYGLKNTLDGTWTRYSRTFYTHLAVILLVLIVPELYSRYLLQQRDVSETISVGIVQPDKDPYDKWGEGETPLGKVQDLIHIYDSLVVHDEVDLVIMPETAIPFRILQPSYYDDWLWLRNHIDSVGVPLMTGFAYLQWYEQGDHPASSKSTPDGQHHYDDFNAAMFVQPGTPYLQVYKKTKLTPMSERIPYLEQMPFLQDILTWGVGISNWGIGNDTTVFTMADAQGDSLKLWAMICYETIYPEFVSGFVARGADFLCVITNDGWFGPTSGPYQLKQYAVLRAVENRRAIARSANNGVSCFIDPYGYVSQETELYTRTGISGPVQLRNELTFYTRFGDWLPMSCAALMLLMILAAAIRGRNTPKE